VRDADARGHDGIELGGPGRELCARWAGGAGPQAPPTGEHVSAPQMAGATSQGEPTDWQGDQGSIHIQVEYCAHGASSSHRHRHPPSRFQPSALFHKLPYQLVKEKKKIQRAHSASQLAPYTPLMAGAGVANPPVRALPIMRATLPI